MQLNVKSTCHIKNRFLSVQFDFPFKLQSELSFKLKTKNNKNKKIFVVLKFKTQLGLPFEGK